MANKDYDPLDTTSREEAEELARNKVALSEKVERDDMIWMMRTRQGRRCIYRLLERAGIWRLSFSTNGMQMAFNEGNRNVGLQLMAKLADWCDETYSLMLKEHKEDV
jgi:hypothetical protein